MIPEPNTSPISKILFLINSTDFLSMIYLLYMEAIAAITTLFLAHLSNGIQILKSDFTWKYAKIVAISLKYSN